MKNNSFEDKIKLSKKILEKLMDPEISLEDGVKLYKDGIKELQEANKLLEDAKLTIDEYNKDTNN
jgi:exodeoxyribonuclease VII small subunit